MQMNAIFRQALPVLNKIEQAGYEAYFVGGSVRDLVIGREVNDVDIATSATPDELKKIFSRTVDVGIEHGTILVIEDDRNYEITTFRTESGYSDFRRPDSVSYVRSLEEDLKRRDFTMNSMALNKDGEIIDPFEGKAAIAKRVIQTVGNPDERFNEDALRMMRAIRFVSQLGFQLEDVTFQSIKQHGQLLSNISIERIVVEFEKTLSGRYRKQALQLMVESELYRYLPELKDQQSALKKLVHLPIDSLSVEEIWAVLLMVMNLKDISSFLRKWKLSVKKIKWIKRLIEYASMEPHFAEKPYHLIRCGLEESIQAAKVRATFKNESLINIEDTITSMYNDLVIKDALELAVDGRELIAWRNISAGPWVREYLALILEAVLDRKLENDKGKIKEWLIACNLM